MASLNRVILIGNLTRDPELRFTPNGTPVANFGLAVNRKWTNKQGEKVEGVDYINIVVWGRLAELCGDYISKGSPVAIDGRLQSRTWEAEDGGKRNAIEVVAENVQFLGRKQTEFPSSQTGINEAQRLVGSEDIENDNGIGTAGPAASVLEEDIPF